MVKTNEQLEEDIDLLMQYVITLNKACGNPIKTLARDHKDETEQPTPPMSPTFSGGNWTVTEFPGGININRSTPILQEDLINWDNYNRQQHQIDGDGSGVVAMNNLPNRVADYVIDTSATTGVESTPATTGVNESAIID